MKKHVVMAVSAMLAATSLFAYNPPAGGQNLLRLSSPFSLAGANSTAGGAMNDAIPSSVLTNPALQAFEQRIVLDVGFTFMSDKNKEKNSGNDIGTAFQLGATIPTRWCVPTLMFQGVFAPLVDMNLANNIAFTANVSKDITDKVSVGLGVTGGGFWNKAASDWTLALNTGVVYNHGDLFIFKNVRFGATLMNIGKMYSETKNMGIKGTDSLGTLIEVTSWPGIATPRGGIAFILLDKGSMKIGGSTDIALPGFQNVALDLGFGLEYSGLKFMTLKLNSAWELDFKELIEGCTNLVPAIGLSAKFNVNTGANATLAKRGWQQSEVTPGFAWRNLYSDINALSVGAVLKLGMEDKDPPEITLWDEEH